MKPIKDIYSIFVRFFFFDRLLHICKIIIQNYIFILKIILIENYISLHLSLFISLLLYTKRIIKLSLLKDLHFIIYFATNTNVYIC